MTLKWKITMAAVISMVAFVIQSMRLSLEGSDG